MTSVLTLHDILFATDFSEASHAAGQTAAALARHFGARLHVLHVVPPATDPTTAPGLMQAVVADLEAGAPVVTAIASGRVAAQIVHYARGHGIDLVVLGTHGRTGVSHALLGSVAEAVIRRARCRVLTVPISVPGPALAAAPAAEVEETTACAVCRGASDGDLICEACRARIRGEALERKLSAERAGRR